MTLLLIYFKICDIKKKRYTVDLVIFACFNFRKFLILGLFEKFIIRKFSFFSSRASIKIIFHEVLEFANLSENLNLANITRSTVVE